MSTINVTDGYMQEIRKILLFKIILKCGRDSLRKFNLRNNLCGDNQWINLHACPPFPWGKCPINNWRQQYLALPIPSSRLNARNAPGICSYCDHQPWKSTVLHVIYLHLLIENLGSTSVMRVRCLSEAALRGWRAWVLNRLLPPSWASCRG